MMVHHDVKTTMRFVKPDSKINRRYITPGIEFNTGKYEIRGVFVRDARPCHQVYSLESTGFQLFDHPSGVIS